MMHRCRCAQALDGHTSARQFKHLDGLSQPYLLLICRDDVIVRHWSTTFLLAEPTQDNSDKLAKRWNDLLPEQFNGISHQVLGHTADFMVGTEDIVSDTLLTCFELANDGPRAANDGEAVLQVELVALGRQTHGLAARLVVGALTVAPHAAGVRPPANARLRNGPPPTRTAPPAGEAMN